MEVQSTPFGIWDEVDNPLIVPSAGASINTPQAGMVSLTELTFGVSNPQALYMGTEGRGLYRSTNGGSSWAYAGRSGETIWAIAVDPMDHTHVYAASSSVGGLDVTTNSGASWADGGLPDRLVYSLSYSPANPQVLYAGTDNGVYRLQAGAWANTGLAGLLVTAVSADPQNSLYVCAGTNAGAYCSSDGGLIWDLVPASFVGAQVRSIYFDTFTEGYVYFNTQERGTLRYNFR